MRLYTYLLTIFLFLGAYAQAQDSSLEKIFYQAVYAETIDGDLAKARGLYEQILESDDVDRLMKAKSLYRLGLISEAEGTENALKYYTRVVEEFSEQKDLISLVQNRVEKLDNENTFIDPRDGHKYKYVKIGDQTWMAENLAFMPWVNPVTKQEYGIWVYDYDGESVAEAMATENYQKYGCLYDWATTMAVDPAYNEREWGENPENNQGLCPPGWKMPSDKDWMELEIALGMPDSLANLEDDVRAGSYTTSRQIHLDYPPIGRFFKSESEWQSGGNGNNSSGMNVLPAGVRTSYDAREFSSLGYSAEFWTSSDTIWKYSRDSIPEIYYYALYRSFTGKGNKDNIGRMIWRNRTSGLSIRCIKTDKPQVEAPNQNFIKKGLKSIVNISSIESTEIISPKLISKFENPESKKHTWPIVATDNEHFYYSPNTGWIFALDITTMDTIWRRDLGEDISFSKQFKLEGNSLFCATRTRLINVDKLTGKILWEKMKKDEGEFGFSRLNNGVLYVGHGESMSAIRVSDGEEIWSHKEENCSFYYPDFDEKSIFNSVYIKGQTNSKYSTKNSILMALNKLSGEKTWEKTILGPIWTCCYYKGLVYVIPSSREEGSNLIAFDSNTGEKAFKVYLNSNAMNGRIAISDNKLFFVSRGYNNAGLTFIFSMNPDGTINWKTKIKGGRGELNQAPVIHDDKVFLILDYGEENRKLVAIDQKTGTKKYIFDTVETSFHYPIFQNNKIFVRAKGALYIYEYPEMD